MSPEIAFYGKGGIGKSTVASNVSYMLASAGHTVSHIGCDPKHDSVRPLCGERDLSTVIDYIRSTSPSERRLEDIVVTGTKGIRCVEAGGPEAGVGCAGKGIITMFHILEILGFYSQKSDFTVYDVLGDVVCGGFAVPMRPEHSDIIFIVSSGEFMSVYAANNIMRGMMNFGTGAPRLGGIIFNSRGSPTEDALIEEFSRATKVPVIAKIPRSTLFEQAEAGRTTVSDMFPCSEVAEVFRSLSEYISNIAEKDLCSALPLSDRQLDQLSESRRVEGFGEYERKAVKIMPAKAECGTPSVFQPSKRIGTGPVGAAITADKVTDIPVIIHGTRSCGSSMLNELHLERLEHLALNPGSSVGTGDNMFCSDINAVASIFGGAANLENLLESLASSHRVILVIICCLTNMIGDDVGGAVEKVKSRHPGLRVGVINGNVSLEGVDAHMEVLRFLTDQIDMSITPVTGKVCLADNNYHAVNRGRNGRIFADIMNEFGRIAGRGFISDCNLSDIINLRENEAVFLSENSEDNMALKEMLEAKGIRTAMRYLPRGYRQGCEWADHLGDMFGDSQSASRLRCRMESEYRDALSRYAPIIKGRRFAVINDGTEHIDWIEELLRDSDAGEVYVCLIGPTVNTSGSENVSRFPGYGEARAFLSDSHPDLVIGSPAAIRDIRGLLCEPFPHTTLAHAASIGFMKRICNLLKADLTEGWTEWGSEQ